MSRVLKRMHLEDRFEEQGLFRVWDEEVGTRIARHAKPERITKGRLTVLAENSGYIQEYSFLKKEIVKKLNKRLGRELVKEIVFRVGDVKPARRAATGKRRIKRINKQ